MHDFCGRLYPRGPTDARIKGARQPRSGSDAGKSRPPAVDKEGAQKDVRRLGYEAGHEPRLPRGRVFWVVFAGEEMLSRSLTLCSGQGGEVLAVFSHKEEADMLVRSCEAVGEDWRARKTPAWEVVSLLYGPRCGATSVALDPLPGMLTDGSLGLVTLERRRFVERITGCGMGPAPATAAGRGLTGRRGRCSCAPRAATRPPGGRSPRAAA